MTFIRLNKTFLIMTFIRLNKTKKCSRFLLIVKVICPLLVDQSLAGSRGREMIGGPIQWSFLRLWKWSAVSLV